MGQDSYSNINCQTALNCPQAGQNKSQMMVITMDAYGLGVAARVNASTKLDFQSKNLMMRIDHVEQLTLYSISIKLLEPLHMSLVDRAVPVTGKKFAKLEISLYPNSSTGNQNYRLKETKFS